MKTVPFLCLLILSFQSQAATDFLAASGISWSKQRGFVSNAPRTISGHDIVRNSVKRDGKNIKIDQVTLPGFSLQYESTKSGKLLKSKSLRNFGEEGHHVEISIPGKQITECSLGSSKVIGSDSILNSTIGLYKNSCTFVNSNMCKKLMPILKRNSGFKAENFNRALKAYKQCSDVLNNLQFASQKIIDVLDTEALKASRSTAIKEAESYAKSAGNRMKKAGGKALSLDAKFAPTYDDLEKRINRLKSSSDGSLADAYNTLTDIQALAQNCMTLESQSSGLRDRSYIRTPGKKLNKIEGENR